MARNRRMFTAAALALTGLVAAFRVSAAEVRDIVFPVADGPVSFSDDFGDERWRHPHEGNDILGKKMMPLVAAIDGYVSYLVTPEASWGYAIVLSDAEGYSYHYLHVNNDTPGTDDGRGGTQNAYAQGIYEGARAVRGQRIGWMGDSGNAEDVGPHLHFEIRRPGGEAIDPRASLLAAYSSTTFDPAAAKASSPDINTDRAIAADAAATCVSGTLVKTASSRTVYYCGADGKRYVFPNDKTYYSWYANFNEVTTITDDALAALRLGGNVTYRPGVKLVKIQSDPKVYAVDRGGKLRWIETAEIAAALYGADWAKKIDDVSDAFFVNYTVGAPITSAE